MRRALDALYALSGFLAALSLIAIAAIIVAQVVARALSIQVPSADEFAAYFLVGTGFLALAPTYRRGEHIRVGLLIDRFAGAPRRGVEILVLAVAIIAVGWATYWLGRMVHDSFRFHELSQGLIPVPLWIPQSAMVIGFAVFLIALIEDFITALRGGTPTYLAVKADDNAPQFER
jgi:TRAP-type C4-dicarboxylate transport system permease small subunit